MIVEYLNEDLPLHLIFLDFFFGFIPGSTPEMEAASKVWKLEILFSGK